jgi:Helix-turn-helix domain
MAEPLLYTAEAAKASLGIKNTKFYELLAQGALDARKIGNRTMVTAESLRQFVDGLPRATVSGRSETQESIPTT